MAGNVREAHGFRFGDPGAPHVGQPHDGHSLGGAWPRKQLLGSGASVQHALQSYADPVNAKKGTCPSNNGNNRSLKAAGAGTYPFSLASFGA